jgi:hypothetical protein
MYHCSMPSISSEKMVLEKERRFEGEDIAKQYVN